MAGGEGRRLKPYTNDRPKTLLRVGERPILEHIIRLYADQGFDQFYISVNYLREKIERFAGTGKRFGVSISYIREDEPLGTAGALRLLPRQDEPIILTNSDVLTQVDANDLLRFHNESGCRATVCAAEHQYTVPYGVLEVSKARLKDVREKPTELWPVNAGIYVLSPSLISELPEDASDMPDLIANAGDVAVYELKHPWRDIGTPQDLERANQEWAA